MKFAYLLFSAVSAYLKNVDIHGELYITPGAFGDDIKNRHSCDTWHGECHKCVSAGCEYDSSSSECHLYGGRDTEHYAPRFKEFFERAKVCDDDKNICKKHIINGKY